MISQKKKLAVHLFDWLLMWAKYNITFQYFLPQLALNIFLSSPFEKMKTNENEMRTDLNALFLEAFCTSLTFYLRRIIIRQSFSSLQSTKRVCEIHGAGLKTFTENK